MSSTNVSVLCQQKYKLAQCLLPGCARLLRAIPQSRFVPRLVIHGGVYVVYLGIAPRVELAEPRCGGESVAECPGITKKGAGDTVFCTVEALMSPTAGRLNSADLDREVGSWTQYEGSNKKL